MKGKMVNKCQICGKIGQHKYAYGDTYLYFCVTHLDFDIIRGYINHLESYKKNDKI